MAPCRFRNRVQKVGRAELHLRLKLLVDHQIAQPRRQRRAGLDGAEVLRRGRLNDGTEVGANRREAFFPTRIGRERHALCAAQIAGDNLGVGVGQQETSAIKEFHQGAGAREAAFGEEHQLAATSQIFRHALDRVRRGGIDGEGVAVDHEQAMEPTHAGGGAGGDKLPMVIHAHDDKHPIQPGRVIGNEDDRAGRLQHGRVVGPEAEYQAHQQVEEAFQDWRMGCSANR